MLFLTQLARKETAIQRLISGALIGLSALVAYQADGRLKQWMVDGHGRCRLSGGLKPGRNN